LRSVDEGNCGPRLEPTTAPARPVSVRVILKPTRSSNSHLPMNESMAQALPPELTHEIFQYIDKDQLVSVSLTCRSYQPEAERLLYERITMGDVSTADHTCLRTLTTSLRKTVLVRSFHLDWSRVTKTARLQTLGNALLGMKSLKFLYLRLQRHQAGPVQLVLNSILRCSWEPVIERVRAESSLL
jgi:hypothetical protein